MSEAETKGVLLSLLRHARFPQGKTAGCWLKAVQRDLDAKGIISRTPGKPVRLNKHPPVIE